MTLTKKIAKLFRKWSWLVTHWGWKFTVNYVACSEDMPDGAGASMSTTSHHQYLQGLIWVNLKVCEGESDEMLEEMVVHELCHLLLAPMAQNPESEHEKELTCTTIARCIIGARGK
mgnify:CR=1 FL=1